MTMLPPSGVKYQEIRQGVSQDGGDQGDGERYPNREPQQRQVDISCDDVLVMFGGWGPAKPERPAAHVGPQAKDQHAEHRHDEEQE